MVSRAKRWPLLLVDDEAGIRRVLTVTLADMGYEVHAAGSGAEALQCFDAQRPSIVLADLKMPGMSGIELLKAIKSRRPDTEVIVMTGHGDMEAAIECLKLEATDFITKPLHDDALAIALKRARERIVMRAQLARYTEQLEQMVAEKSRQLIEAERMAAIGQTIAGLSHTIKNIAGGLKGGVFGVDKGLELDEPKYLHEGWAIVKKNVARITRLSMELLNYAKAGQHRCQWGDPNQPMAAVAEFIRPRAEAAGITVTLDPLSPGASFYFDGERIYQALLNLALNALEAFDGAAAADRRIALKTFRRGDGTMAYHVEDNGCGIAPVDREKLFGAFFTTKGSRGTGIGLMMTRQIVDKHGGRIICTSTEGQGTQMVIELPRKEEDNATHPAQ